LLAPRGASIRRRTVAPAQAQQELQTGKLSRETGHLKGGPLMSRFDNRYEESARLNYEQIEEIRFD